MKIAQYASKNRMLVAVDCIIFGFDGTELKLLLIKRGFEPEKGRWSLMGGLMKRDETIDHAASRVLKELTGLENVYMEQLCTFGEVERDPVDRTLSVLYSSLIDINRYTQQINQDYHAEWFPLKKLPSLIFDHRDMVTLAQQKLRYKAAFHPIVFELLPEKFTLPQLQHLYEGIFDTLMDKRNFSRKVLSTGLLVKQKDKERTSSKRGAFYYKLDKRKYQTKFNAFLNFIPNPDSLR
ncbi:NUDIX hydrolase [Chitinophaga deserti]|uniref:NUDIX hydrolase n=1 Tax=Chitinophaga deserti TaxID=2164099 RepID=UPI001E2FC263|nr:NUDIX domain-containing protein [Chitinophaga deserti]